jgi:hypothetical protein
VGFSFTHYLAAEPEPVTNVGYDTAVGVYNLAQQLDSIPGTNYAGTSVLAGAKALKRLYPDEFSTYRWAFNIHDLVQTLGYIGPVVLGVPWYSNFYTPINDMLQIGGAMVGGHAILATGVDIENRRIKLHNSWSENWNKTGCAYISFTDMETLINQRSEMCIILGKK